VAIREIERIAAERDDGAWKEEIPQREATGKTVAVLGSGPAGLTAAYYLARRGHAVNLYEADADIGGVLRAGFPPDRLPPAILDRDLDVIREAGVVFRTGEPAVDPGRLREDHDVVFVEADLSVLPADACPATEAGGVSGPVVDAVAAGRRVASSIDVHLGGDGDITERLHFTDPPAARIGRDEGFAGLRRPAGPLDAGRAAGEASRCLQCDLRLRIQPVTLPPEKWRILSDGALDEVPESEGVYLLLDVEKKVFAIHGVANLRQALAQALAGSDRARYFGFEQDKMYTKRETEIMQAYGLADGGELDDLY
jgi:hypothetical protein